MKTALRCLLVTAMVIAVGAPVYGAAAEAQYEVVQIWRCEMNDGVTEEQVEAIAGDWLKAIKTMPGGAAVKMRVFFPTVASGADTDFYFVMNAPSYAEWGKIWDAYSDDSAAAKSDDLNQGKVNCSDSELWEAHGIQ